MGIRVYLFICILVTGVRSSAQSIVVYHTTGNAVVKEASSIKPAVKGSIINKAGVLQLMAGATCMLIGQSGTSLQIGKTGTYTYQRIMQLMAGAKTETVSAKFFAYVYDNLRYRKEKTALNVIPVVYRAEPLMKTPRQYDFSTPENIFFTWRPSALKSPVHFQLFTGNDSVLIDTVFKKEQLSFIVSSKTLYLIPGQVYKWNAEDGYNRAKVKTYNYFIVLRENDIVAYNKAWKAINNSSFSKDVKLQLWRDLLLKSYNIN